MPKSAYIQMLRHENDGPDLLWQMLDNAAKAAELPTSSEVCFGVRAPFELDLTPSVGSFIKTHLPLAVSVLLSDKQLECFILHNYLLHSIREAKPAWKTETRAANDCLILADRATSLHFNAEFLMGTLIKSAVIEWTWHIFWGSDPGQRLMLSKPESIMSEFRKIHYPKNKAAYNSVLRVGGEIQKDGVKKMDFASRLQSAKVNLDECASSGLREPKSSILNLGIAEFKAVVDAAISSQSDVDYTLGKVG